MIILGVDFHPEFQQIASVDTETREFQEKRLGHREEAETFYHGPDRDRGAETACRVGSLHECQEGYGSNGSAGQRNKGVTGAGCLSRQPRRESRV